MEKDGFMTLCGMYGSVSCHIPTYIRCACVHNVAPPYLHSLLTSYVPSREMRLSRQLILHQLIPNMETYGKRSFAYGGPRLWNNLDKNLPKIVSL